MKIATWACALIAVFIATASSRAAVLVNTVTDFSIAAQGTNGLQYGYYLSTDQTTGTFSTANMSSTSGWWAGTEPAGTPFFTADVQHPGAGTLYSAVRRYTVGSSGETPYSGLVQIMGQFGGGPTWGGASVVGFVAVNGVTLFSAPANLSTTVSFDFQTTVSPGSHIDFGVRTNGDPYSDSTFFSATVISVPEPSKCLLMMVGWLVVFARRSRPAC